MLKNKGALICAFCFSLSCLKGEEIKGCEGSAFPAQGKIAIDGKLNERDWKKAKPISDFKGVMGAQKVEAGTEVRILYGKDSLYIGVELEEPLMEKLKAKGGSIWGDDRIEFPISVSIDSPEYFLFGVNCEGKKEEGCFGNADYDDPIKEFNRPWQAAVSKGKDRWFIEIEIPYKTLGRVPQKGTCWKMNFCRQRSPKGMKTVYSCWVPKFGGFHYAGGNINFK